MSGWQKLNVWPPINERVVMSFGGKIYYGYFKLISSDENSYPWIRAIVDTKDNINAEWSDYWMKLSIPE